MTSVLKMTWDLMGGGTITWNMPDPKVNLTRPEVVTAMNAVVDGTIIIKNGLEAVTMKDAYIYQTNKIEIPDE